MARIILCLAFVSALAAPAAAQSGRVYGSVTDETGAVLPAVDIRAIMRDTTGETTRSVVTDARGTYDLGNLAPGAWVLTTTLPGFEATTQRMNVQTGDSLEWSPTLQIGTIQETVSVTTAASNEPVRTESAVPPAPVPAVSPGPVSSGTVPLRVGGSIKPPRKIVHVRPVYPAEAASAGIGGVVILRAVISTDGVVREVSVLRSPNDSLSIAATSAIIGWQFTPTLLNGMPVQTRMTATFNFQQSF